MRVSDCAFIFIACAILWLSVELPTPFKTFLRQRDPQITSERPKMYDQLVLFGDSLFQHSSSQDRGFALAPALQAAYIRRLDVINRGFSGYNTDQAFRILPDVIRNPEYGKIRFLIIFFGANDSCLKGAQGGQHVPIEQFRENLVKIIRHPSVEQHHPRIILLSPPPVDEYGCEESDRAKGYKNPRRQAEHTKLYADVVRHIAELHDIAFVDVWTILMKEAGYVAGDEALPGSKALPPNPQLRSYLHDGENSLRQACLAFCPAKRGQGVHFSHFAYSAVYQEIVRVIQRNWPEHAPDNLPFVLPMWNDPSAW